MKRLICTHISDLIHLDQGKCAGCGSETWMEPEKHLGGMVHAQVCYQCEVIFYDCREIEEIEKNPGLTGSETKW